jgi:hypothetical protein
MLHHKPQPRIPIKSFSPGSGSHHALPLPPMSQARLLTLHIDATVVGEQLQQGALAHYVRPAGVGRLRVLSERMDRETVAVVVVVDEDAHRGILSEEMLPSAHGANHFPAGRRSDRVQERAMRPVRRL